jgi:protein-disulfide isomerase/uncharacterized membrane protein
VRSPRLALVLFVLALAGAAVAVYLTAFHEAMLWGDLSLARACGAQGVAHCGAVVASRYGQWGPFPVSLLGLWFYVAVACLALAAWFADGEAAAPPLRSLWWLALLALLADLYLAWAMWARLANTCALCVATYALNAAIFVLATLALRGRGAAPWGALLLGPDFAALRARAAPAYPRAALTLVLLGFVAVVAIGTAAWSALGQWSVASKERSNVTGLLQYLEAAEPLPVAPGEKTRGPAGAPVSITVFSDFTCEQCKVLSHYLAVVAANRRDSLELAYRHYTLDPACNPGTAGEGHEGSCRLAHAAECARRQGRFWQFHDAVFADERPVDAERIDDYARRAGLDLDQLHACLADSSALEPVRRDIALGDSLAVDATPTVFLNGRAVVGVFKPWIWEEAVRVVGRLPR